ncbi:hypothetical protein VP01_905g7 [Puccinia sorghi]|uniref:Uncharacterized protein n=1 Tax=Puccinia sorghi TaxID=27349 RepID=A0A0L6U8C1_9BASI|nr:hypothetical protein VP01_905g7 [Puccinia sorghi]
MYPNLTNALTFTREVPHQPQGEPHFPSTTQVCEIPRPVINAPICQATARTSACDAMKAPHEYQKNQFLREEQDFLAAKFKLKQSKLTSPTISVIFNTIKTKDFLKSNVSNFSQWTQTLSEIGRPEPRNSPPLQEQTLTSNLTGPKFFFTPCNNLTFKKIGHTVFLVPVNNSFLNDLQDIKLLHDMYISIKKSSQTNSCAAQMNFWYKFILNAQGSVYRTVSISMSSNMFLGFLLQASIMASNAGFKADFKQQVDLSHFGKCSADNFEITAFLADINENEWTGALDFFALTPHRCWSFRGKNHYSRNFPTKSAGQHQQPYHSDQGKTLGTILGTIYGHLPSGFQVNSARFPNLNNWWTPPVASHYQQQVWRLADHYHPRPSQKSLSRRLKSDFLRIWMTLTMTFYFSIISSFCQDQSLYLYLETRVATSSLVWSLYRQGNSCWSQP